MRRLPLSLFTFRSSHYRFHSTIRRASVMATTHTAPPPQNPSFYMRELPKQHCIGYETTEGKALFKQALLEGGLEAFFPLSQQFLTQNEPAYCGLGTLCMILNALKVDPAVTWRKPWRWFTQEMLDCCRPLEWVKKNGITLSEFSCLAKCNGLEATTKFATQISLEEFTEAVKKCTSSTDELMAVSYSRVTLGQTGSGHFSPAAGYTSKNGGMVLILDVARFKYPSYWVPIKVLYDALIPADQATGQPRGYAILRRRQVSGARSSLLRLNATATTWPMLFEPLCQIAACASSYDELVQTLASCLEKPTSLPAVTSRLERNTLPVKMMNSPSFNAAEGAEARHDYEKNVDELYKHFQDNSKMYQSLKIDELWKTEVVVFLLALLDMERILRGLSKELRDEVKTHMQAELSDERIRKEVTEVRTQMSSLETCCGECRDGACDKDKGCCN